MKLELKHIAPYLPYKVNVIHNTSNIKFEVKGVKFGVKSCNLFLKELRLPQSLWKFKPILRPLSDLTKEIQIAEYYMTYKEHIQRMFNLRMYQFKDAKIYSLNYGVFIDFTELPYNVVEKLLSWHFDVFGLITQGLAIDINTL